MRPLLVLHPLLELSSLTRFVWCNDALTLVLTVRPTLNSIRLYRRALCELSYNEWHYTISWKVAGSIPDVTACFCSFCSRTVPLGSTQLLTEMSTTKCFWGEKLGRRLRLTAWLPSVSWLSSQCGILDFSRRYRPLRPDSEIALLFLHVDYIRTSQESHLWAFMLCYRDSFPLPRNTSLKWIRVGRSSYTVLVKQ
jgi:hypothetical protein